MGALTDKYSVLETQVCFKNLPMSSHLSEFLYVLLNYNLAESGAPSHGILKVLCEIRLLFFSIVDYSDLYLIKMIHSLEFVQENRMFWLHLLLPLK